MSRYGQATKCDWASVDWTKQNSALGRELGVSAERVRQMRKKLDKPDSPLKYRREATPGYECVKQSYSPDLTIHEIAAEAGVSKTVAYFGLKGLPRKKANKKYNWESVDWSKLNVEIAKELGAHIIHVARYRKRFAPPSLRVSPYHTKRTKKTQQP